MSKGTVYLVGYEYTETFCSPHESEWERRTRVICATLDEKLADETVRKHNQSQTCYTKHASIKSYELS